MCHQIGLNEYNMVPAYLVHFTIDHIEWDWMTLKKIEDTADQALPVVQHFGNELEKEFDTLPNWSHLKLIPPMRGWNLWQIRKNQSTGLVPIINYAVDARVPSVLHTLHIDRVAHLVSHNRVGEHNWIGRKVLVNMQLQHEDGSGWKAKGNSFHLNAMAPSKVGGAHTSP